MHNGTMHNSIVSNSINNQGYSFLLQLNSSSTVLLYSGEWKLKVSTGEEYKLF